MSQMAYVLTFFSLISDSLGSKALRCTFFGEWKNSFSLKFGQLELLSKAKASTSKIRAA